MLELSWYGAGEMPVPLGGAFHSRACELDVEPGRQDRALASRALELSRAGCARRLLCSPIRCSTP